MPTRESAANYQYEKAKGERLEARTLLRMEALARQNFPPWNEAMLVALQISRGWRPIIHFL